MNIYEKYVLVITVVTVLINGLLYKYKEGLNMNIQKVFKKDKRLGTALFVLFSSGITLFLAPTTPFNIIALYLYKPLEALAVVVLFHLISGITAFYLARKYQPESLKKRLKKNKIYNLLSDNDDISFYDWTALCSLSRLSMSFPFSVISYMWGFTKIPFEAYLIGTTIGAIIPILLELYLLYNVGELIEGKGKKHIFISIIFTLGTIYAMDRIMKNLLHKQALKHSDLDKSIKSANSTLKGHM